MSAITPDQILVPKKVHIGDTAELRCTFSFNSPKLRNLVENGTAQIPVSSFAEEINENNLEILKVELFQAGVDTYQLSISFIPWKTGLFNLPKIKIADVELIFRPEEVISLTKEYDTTTLRDSTSPLLLPGTTYKVYGSIILLVVFIVLGICLIVKRKKVGFFVRNKLLQRRYKKNKKKTIKQLKNIAALQISDSEAAGNIQNILRKYLEYRFAYPFTRTVTSELVSVFYKITQSLLSETKYEAFGEIANSFIRTDYIRYSKNSSFLINEKKELIQKIINNIEILEGVEDA